MLIDTQDKLEKAGFVIRHVHTTPNQDVTVILVSDRCLLKDKQSPCLAVAFSGLEMLQDQNVIDYKVDLACYAYANKMKEYGGFEPVGRKK